MLHIALCDDNPASIEILEKYFDILNDSTIDYDVYFRIISGNPRQFNYRDESANCAYLHS